MPARTRTTKRRTAEQTDPVIYIHARGTTPPDADWLDQVGALGCTLTGHGEWRGVKQTQHGYDRLGELLLELAQAFPGRPVILLRAGVLPTKRQIEQVESWLRSASGACGMTALSNAAPELNPYSGLQARTTPEWTACAAAVELMGRPALHRWRRWPDHFLALSHALVERLANSEHSADDVLDSGDADLWLAERLFVADLRSDPLAALRLAPGESPRPTAWGELSATLQGWLDAGGREPRIPGLAGRPVTLHITHSWGGGVGLWTESFIENDEDSDHLQLRSEQIQSGAGAGQRLALYLANDLSYPLARWHLQPAIESVTARHAAHQEALAEIQQRFGIGRVVVSSLIGHSLEVLRTGLPTIQVLHDLFPLWPLLSVHPDSYLGDDGIDLERALAEHRDTAEFGDHSAAGWKQIREVCLDAMSGEVTLVAPSQAVVDLLGRLGADRIARGVAVIPHGLPLLASKDVDPIVPRPRGDKRLRLVIPGRIQPGKGKQLLLEALPGLRPYAQVYLLGAGKHGEDFFGQPGVSVVLQYQRDAFADLLRTLGPHLAALLSVVPETYSFTLSELHALGVPVIATRRGSFPERIEPDQTGWLIEPNAGELVAAVAALAEDAGRLDAVRTTLTGQPALAARDMVSAYNALCAPIASPAIQPEPVDGTREADTSAAALFGLQAQSENRRLANALTEAERELNRRSRWAERADRALKKIEARNAQIEQELLQRAQWAREADEQAERARERIAELDTLLDERTAWARELDRELAQEREHLAQEREQRADLEQQLQHLEGELQESHRQLQVVERDLAEAQRLLEQGALDLHQARHERDQLQALQDRILASTSWRLTRPLRAMRRTLVNARQARAYNPARWPLLVSRGVRLLATLGLRGTLARLQSPPQSAAEDPHRRSAVDSRRESETTPPPQSQPSKQPAEASPRSETREASATDQTQSQPLVLPVSAAPRVSIVIPAYNQWDFTERCLRSLARWGAKAAFEVILVDDASGDETRSEARAINGLKYLRNDSNRGFIDSCNRGAGAAQGEFLVFLNNDTEVTEDWLDRLVDTFEVEDGVGLVGAKLVYPDGRLQECGGLVFRDGSGWNYGRNDQPDRPDYAFVREVDYCSGACIMLRTATFLELGGFDTHYRPAYYEDTDLAFRIRQRGERVLIQPAAVVVHHEGVTSGTDTASGTKRFQDVNREKFLQRWATDLDRQPPPMTDPEDLRQLRAARDHRLKGRVLVIDATTPEPDQDSGSVRLTNLMRCFRELGYGVTFFADNRMHAGRYTRQLQQSGVEVQYLPWLDPVRAFFEERGDEFDYVFISRHYIAINYLSLLRRHCARAPFIFDTVDLHYLREQRLAELEGSVALRQVARQTRRSELSVATAADATVVVSPVEIEVLANDAPTARTHVISNIHEVPGRRAGFDERKDLFFVGGYQHPPNVDAALWFVRDIWPRVRERLPEVSFHLIGSKAPEEIRSLDAEGVRFHGFVDRLEPFLDGCRLAVAPLRYGAGVKGKVNMSMSYGQPVVATPIAVEGMYAEHGRDVLVAETAEEFADRIVELYRDPELWARLSDGAVENVRRHFSLDAARRAIADLLDGLRPPADA